MKWIVTTSDKYLHVLPVFFYLFNKHLGYQAELVGYTKPEGLPDNFTFHSMGEDRGAKYWSTDLRAYFDKQDDWFVWIMEDTFVKGWDEDKYKDSVAMCYNGIGRVDLTKDVQKRTHTKNNGYAWGHPQERYRLSTQPSIWSKQFLMNYLHEGMTPWEFETQDPKDDGWQIVGAVDYPMLHNEGVRRHDIHAFNMDGIDDPEVLKLCSDYI